jgi:hypothetical protein
VILLSIEAHKLLGLAGTLNVADTDIAHVLSVAPDQVMSWRLGDRIPRRHAAPLVALLQVTLVKAAVDCKRLGEPEDVQRSVSELAERLRDASAPVFRDRDMAKKCLRIKARMIRALESADKRREYRASSGLPAFDKLGGINQ